MEDLSFSNVTQLSNKIIDQYLSHKYDRIELIYNQFKNAAVQILQIEQYLPMKFEKVKEDAEKEYIDYIFEPSKDYILQNLIPKLLKIQFYKAILDSSASEHGARMTSMHKATDNASELIDELRLYYNKARQSSITNELLEIVGGAEALKGK